MNDDVYDELARLSLRRERTVNDRLRIEAVLAAHPELRGRWEEDAALARAMRGLHDVPVSSNFTAQVMDAIALDERATGRKAGAGRWREWLHGWQPKLSWSVVIVLLVGFGVYERQALKRARMALDLGVVSHELAALPDPRVLQDFDAINQLRQVATASDDELLRALQ